MVCNQLNTNTKRQELCCGTVEILLWKSSLKAWQLDIQNAAVYSTKFPQDKRVCITTFKQMATEINKCASTRFDLVGGSKPQLTASGTAMDNIAQHDSTSFLWPTATTPTAQHYSSALNHSPITHFLYTLMLCFLILCIYILMIMSLKCASVFYIYTHILLV